MYFIMYGVQRAQSSWVQGVEASGEEVLLHYVVSPTM